MESEFDRLVDRVMSTGSVESGRTVKSPSTTPLFVAHAVLDGKEYVITVVPTDLESLEGMEG